MLSALFRRISVVLCVFVAFTSRAPRANAKPHVQPLVPFIPKSHSVLLITSVFAPRSYLHIPSQTFSHTFLLFPLHHPFIRPSKILLIPSRYRLCSTFRSDFLNMSRSLRPLFVFVFSAMLSYFSRQQPSYFVCYPPSHPIESTSSLINLSHLKDSLPFMQQCKQRHPTLNRLRSAWRFRGMAAHWTHCPYIAITLSFSLQCNLQSKFPPSHSRVPPMTFCVLIPLSLLCLFST